MTFSKESNLLLLSYVLMRVKFFVFVRGGKDRIVFINIWGANKILIVCCIAYNHEYKPFLGEKFGKYKN